MLTILTVAVGVVVITVLLDVIDNAGRGHQEPPSLDELKAIYYTRQRWYF